MTTMFELYRDMINHFPRPQDHAGRSRSLHEGFSILEYQFRFAGVLANAISRGLQDVRAVPIPRVAGMGEWLNYVRHARIELMQGESSGAVQATDLLNALLEQVDRQSVTASPHATGLQQLRNHLAHGGPVPNGVDTAVLNDLIDALTKRIRDAFSSADLRTAPLRNGVRKLHLGWGGESITLWPTLFKDSSDDVLLFAQAPSAKTVAFARFGANVGRTAYDSEDVVRDASVVLRVVRDKTPVRAYMSDVAEDLKGFAEDETRIHFGEHGDGFEFVWGKATSEGTELRRDYFRLGLDDRREWQGQEGWVPYSSYLRGLIRWGVVATRLWQDLQRLESELTTDEASLLGWTERSASATREPRVQISDLSGQIERSASFSDLLRGVDQDLQSNRGQTQVVFVNGEAGIGKTRALLSAALERARQISEAYERGDKSPLPLYLYVRSTGTVLDNLDTVVAGTVVNTRILTDAGVKALCRNGLMTVFIDGFDELLGNVRYGDALGSLRPWLMELGGRGVMVVSARSSYYLGQYRASVYRAQKTDLPLVRHRIAEIQRWTKDDVQSFLSEFGVAVTALDSLKPEDRHLLRLPFFARVFVELCLSSQQCELSSLAEFLLLQYVTREESKIIDPGGDSFIERNELRTMFCYVAELMDERSEREADTDTLKTAAEFAIGSSLDEREGLEVRLPALCGLAVDQGSDALRFRFQHELFFDQFLAGAVTAYLKGSHTQPFLRMMSRSVWRSATLSSVVNDVGVEPLVAVLRADAASFTPESDKARNALRTNLGGLWSEIIRVSGRMRFEIRQAYFADALDLTASSPSWINVIDSEAEEIKVPGGTGWEIQLVNSIVERIDARLQSDLSGLRGVRANSVRQLTLPGRLIERKSEIREALTSRGAAMTDQEPASQETRSMREQAAEYFLEQLSNRAEYSMVLTDKLMPADEPLPKWTMQFGRSTWQKWVRAMVDSKLATTESFDASGGAKVRFKLQIAAEEVVNQLTDEPRVLAFWSSVRATA